MWKVQLLLLVQVIVYLEFIRLVVLPIVLHLLLSKLCFLSAHRILSLHRRCTFMLPLNTLLNKGVGDLRDNSAFALALLLVMLFYWAFGSTFWVLG
jgi:hypothetical protein